MWAGRRLGAPGARDRALGRTPDPRRPAEHRFVTTVAVTRAIRVAAPGSVSGRVRYVDQSSADGG